MGFSAAACPPKYWGSAPFIGRYRLDISGWWVLGLIRVSGFLELVGVRKRIIGIFGYV